VTPEQLASAIQILGVTGLLALALLSFYKRWVVMGWQYDAVARERDEWKAMALAGLQTAADVSQAAKRHTMFTPEEAEIALRVVREAGRSRDE
jgi:hypothetical protein